MVDGLWLVWLVWLMVDGWFGWFGLDCWIVALLHYW
jgi:hypothetical protein